MATIKTANEYFEQVVGYNLQQYEKQATCLPAAYNLANALFNMRDWVWESYGIKQLEQRLGVELSNKSAFEEHIKSNCPAFKYMRDVANASKHVSLIKPSTHATHISDTYNTGWGEGGYGEGRYGGSILIDDGGTKVDFKCKAEEVYSYWKKILEDMR